MALETIYSHRHAPFSKVVSVALGDEIPLKWTLRDADSVDITTGTFSLSLQIYKLSDDLTDLVATVPNGDLIYALPVVSTNVRVTAASPHWTNQIKGKYRAKLHGTYNGSKVTPSEFIIEVTD
jgi:hypothetical protein